MPAKRNQVLVAASVAMWSMTVAPGWSQSSIVAYGAQDVFVTDVVLDDARRDALIAFIQSYEPMSADLRQTTLDAVRQPTVSIDLVQRFEALMAQR